MFKKLLLSTIWLLFISCGNYSILEKLGPQDDESYFRFELGNSWAYSAKSIVPGQGTNEFTFTNTITTSPTFGSGYLIFTNGSGENATDTKISAFYRSKYGYRHSVNLLYALATNSTGAVATPATIDLPYIEYPFVEGRILQETRVQVISNFPLLQSATPALVQVVYSVSNYVEKNNLTIEVNGHEFENCVKFHHTFSIEISALADNAPYLTGDSIQISKDQMLLYLAKNVGLIKISRLFTERNQLNQYSELYIEADLLQFFPF